MVNSEVIETRREKIKKYLSMGKSNVEIMKALNLKPDTYYRDKRAIKEEVKNLIQREPIEKILVESLIKYDSISQEAWRTYLTTENDNVKIGALKTLKEIVDGKVKILQNLGIIEEKPIKLEHSGNIEFIKLVEEIVNEDKGNGKEDSKKIHK